MGDGNVASIRLTTADRESIAKGMLKHRFAKDAARLVKDRAAFALAVYEDIYKPKDRAAMEALPKGWLPEKDHIAVKFADKFTQLPFSGCVSLGYDYRDLASVEAINRRVIGKHANACAAVYEATHKLAIRYELLSQRRSAFKQELREAETQITAALGSVTTTNRLLELWPEASPFVASLGVKAATALPALPTDKLNAMLGLPVRGALSVAA